MDYKKIAEYNLLSLAYLGDAVWDLAVRAYFFEQNLKVEKFNILVKKYVNAKSQSFVYNKIFDDLPKELQILSKRGRNTKIKSFPKSCTPKEYRDATAFEVLLAVYHLQNKKDEIEKIIKYLVEGDLINEK